MIRPQYHFRKGPKGLCGWNVARLIRLSQPLPVSWVPLDRIAELDEVYWGDGAMTVRDVAVHAELIAASDANIPILLCDQGRVMDGMHRVVKALLEGRESLPARRFPVTPLPDVEDAVPDDLSYDPKDFII